MTLSPALAVALSVIAIVVACGATVVAAVSNHRIKTSRRAAVRASAVASTAMASGAATAPPAPDRTPFYAVCVAVFCVGAALLFVSSEPPAVQPASPEVTVAFPGTGKHPLPVRCTARIGRASPAGGDASAIEVRASDTFVITVRLRCPAPLRTAPAVTIGSGPRLGTTDTRRVFLIPPARGGAVEYAWSAFVSVRPTQLVVSKASDYVFGALSSGGTSYAGPAQSVAIAYPWTLARFQSIAADNVGAVLTIVAVIVGFVRYVRDPTQPLPTFPAAATAGVTLPALTGAAGAVPPMTPQAVQSSSGIYWEAQCGDNLCWDACLRMVATYFKLPVESQCAVAQRFVPGASGCCDARGNCVKPMPGRCDQPYDPMEIATLYATYRIRADFRPGRVSLGDELSVQHLLADGPIQLLYVLGGQKHVAVVFGFSDAAAPALYQVHDPWRGARNLAFADVVQPAAGDPNSFVGALWTLKVAT